MNEDEIERKAVEEILLEANTSRHRADELGVVGWKRSRYVTNKRFLFNTLVSAVNSQRPASRSQGSFKHSNNRSTSSATEIRSATSSEATGRDLERARPDPSRDGKSLHTDSIPHKRRKSDDGLRRDECRKRYMEKERDLLDSGNDASSRTSRELLLHAPDRKTSKSDVYDVNDYIRLNRKAMQK